MRRASRPNHTAQSYAYRTGQCGGYATLDRSES